MKRTSSVSARALTIALTIVMPVLAPAVEKPENTEMVTFHSGGRPYEFWTASKKYKPEDEKAFFKEKFDSCLFATRDHRYCLCMINYYFQDHGLTRDELMDMDLAFNRVIRDRSGKIVPGRVDQYRADPVFHPYFDYGKRAALSCRHLLKVK